MTRSVQLITKEVEDSTEGRCEWPVLNNALRSHGMAVKLDVQLQPTSESIVLVENILSSKNCGKRKHIPNKTRGRTKS